MDVFTCGAFIDPWVSCNYLKAFKVKNMAAKEIQRVFLMEININSNLLCNSSQQGENNVRRGIYVPSRAWKWFIEYTHPTQAICMEWINILQGKRLFKM